MSLKYEEPGLTEEELDSDLGRGAEAESHKKSFQLLGPASSLYFKVTRKSVSRP
jgi:hypothetical protein